MANPRKFSEKIALHTQKQAEETAAFEAIMREVSGATRMPGTSYHPNVHMGQPYIGKYMGGSLPNVSQLANNSVDLQGALHHLEDIKHTSGRHMIVERIHNRERSRQARHNARPFPVDKRLPSEPSPYSTPYLSPPPPSEWRRVSSDSALHTSAMGPPQPTYSHNSPQTPRRVTEVANDGSMTPTGHHQYKPYWDSKKNTKPTVNLQEFEKMMNSQKLHSRPKSCGEVPGISIYPTVDTDTSHHLTNNIPMSSNTGSLPDLTILQFPSPLSTPLDLEEHQSSTSSYPQGNSASLSPTSPHPMVGGMGIPVPQSPSRRRPHVSPSPLVLGSPTHLRHNLPGSGLANPLQQRYQLYRQKHRQLTQQQKNPLLNNLTNSQGAITQYRNGTDPCQSPTSPLSQHSPCSPQQSPGLTPPGSTSNPFSDSFFMQQQQQQQQQRHYSHQASGPGVVTPALQQQFEQFSMVSGISDPLSDSYYLQLRPADAGGVAPLPPPQSYDRPNLLPDNHVISSAMQTSAYGLSNNSMHYSYPTILSTTKEQDETGSALYQPSSHQQLLNGQHHQQHGHVSQSADTHRHSANNQIPDIVLTDVDDSMSRQTFSKDLSNSMSFDSDLFPTDEVLKAGLDPLDLTGLQMLTDPNMVADPATEDTFRLDRL